MRILFVGDPHLKISRFDLAVRFLNWVCEVKEELKPDLVVNLGDTFNDHAVLRSEIISEFKKHVRDIVRDGTEYFYVLGNHDQHKPGDSKYHALQGIDGINNFHVFDKIVETEGITYVPYTHNPEEFPKIKTQLCVAHQTFIGCDYGFFRPEEGVKGPDTGAELIISGHIHMRQQFDNVIYPGTPYAQNLNDINQSKGLLLFDASSYVCEYVESPFPLYKGLKFDLRETSVDDLHTYTVSQINTTDHWVLDLTGSKVDINGYINSQEFNDLRGNADIRIRTSYTDKNKQRKRIQGITIQSVIKEYIDNIYDGTLDKQVLYNKALKTLEKVDNASYK